MFESTIEFIEINQDGIVYGCTYDIDLKECDVILYDEENKVISKIKEIMNQIREREKIKE